MDINVRSPIFVLPPAVVARIAAGEVITRPRAAVKELLDNALDAGATRVEIEIASGGYDLVAVHDDGRGIPVDDAPLLFARHATSKLGPSGRLDAVETLGFRGEALASLAAVARVEVRSRHIAESSGFRARVTDDAEPEIRRAARQVGTSVEARDLFARSPVRRRAAEPAGEARAIRRLVGQYAVGFADVAFVFRSEGRTILQTTGDGVDTAMVVVYGDDVAADLLDIPYVDGGWYTLEGVVSAPGISRAGRDGIVLTVNRRPCGVPELQRAVERAFADVLPRHRFPFARVALCTSPGRVDINVHPSKEQVVVDGAREVADRLERELRTLLGQTAHRVAEKRSLALDAAALPGLRVGESGAPYDGGSWGARVVEAGALPRLRVVGHVDDTLIVCESELGTLLIDQHRAHERVIYERLLASESVRLDLPATFNLPIELLDPLDDQREGLTACGWRYDDLGDGRVRVLATPEGLAPEDLAPIVERFTAEDAHSILAAAACHAAIRKRRPLTPDAAVELLAALTATTTPTTCPHGQPIVLNLDRAFLERQFGWR